MRGEKWALPLIERGCSVGVERARGTYTVYTTLLRAASGGYTWLQQGPVFSRASVRSTVEDVLYVLRAAGKEPRLLESAKEFLGGRPPGRRVAPPPLWKNLRGRRRAELERQRAATL